MPFTLMSMDVPAICYVGMFLRAWHGMKGRVWKKEKEFSLNENVSFFFLSVSGHKQSNRYRSKVMSRKERNHTYSWVFICHNAITTCNAPWILIIKAFALPEEEYTSNDFVRFAIGPSSERAMIVYINMWRCFKCIYIDTYMCASMNSRAESFQSRGNYRFFQL